MQAEYQRHNLIFKRPGGTSRGVLTEKETYFYIFLMGKRKEQENVAFSVDSVMTMFPIMKKAAVAL